MRFLLLLIEAARTGLLFQFSGEMARDAFKALKDMVLKPASRRPRRMDTDIIRRSRSVGELEAPQYELIEPGSANGGTIQPGEGLAPHPDDADKVAVEFTTKENKDGSRVRVLNPHSSAARETRRGGDTEVPPSVLHLTQPWFYPDMGRDKAESVLARLGLQDGSFLVRACSSHMAISLAHEERVVHFYIRSYLDTSCNELQYYIETNHAHASVYKLVKYYSVHKGILPVTLGSAASRVLYFRRCSEEATRKHRLNMERRAERAVNSNGIKGESASKPRRSLV